MEVSESTLSGVEEAVKAMEDALGVQDPRAAAATALYELGA